MGDDPGYIFLLELSLGDHLEHAGFAVAKNCQLSIQPGNFSFPSFMLIFRQLEL